MQPLFQAVSAWAFFATCKHMEKHARCHFITLFLQFSFQTWGRDRSHWRCWPRLAWGSKTKVATLGSKSALEMQLKSRKHLRPAFVTRRKRNHSAASIGKGDWQDHYECARKKRNPLIGVRQPRFKEHPILWQRRKCLMLYWFEFSTSDACLRSWSRRFCVSKCFPCFKFSIWPLLLPI